MYDLEQRLLVFSKQLVKYVKSIHSYDINKNIIAQVLRSGTSVGANYCEANGSSSRKDFTNKIYICKKEAKETVYRLAILLEITEINKEILVQLLQEANEIAAIFTKIGRTLRNNSSSKSTKF